MNNPYDDWSSPLFKGGAIIYVEDFIKRAGIDEADVDTMLAAGLGQDGYIENNRRGLLVRTLPSREDLEALGLRPRADYTPEFFWGPDGPSYDGWYMQWD